MFRRLGIPTSATAAAVVSLLALAAPAQAAVYTIGLLAESPALYSQTVNVSGSSFSDSFVFTLADDASTSSAAAVSLDLLALLNIDNLVLSLFDSSGTLLASGSSGESSQLVAQSLTAGATYTYAVSGTVLGTSGGAYTFMATSSQTLSPSNLTLPEPGSLALVGASLSGLTLARRRGRAWNTAAACGNTLWPAAARSA